jgi:hypothetical protein
VPSFSQSSTAKLDALLRRVQPTDNWENKSTREERERNRESEIGGRVKDQEWQEDGPLVDGIQKGRR